MTGRERSIPPPKADPGMQATDDHVAAAAPRGSSHQPAEGLDRGTGDEHVSSPSQGVRPVEHDRTDRRPAGSDPLAEGGESDGPADDRGDDAAGGGPSGEEDTGSGPAFEPER